MIKKKDLLLRSMMFVPLHNQKFIDKAVLSEADALILDLEDSVPPSRRQEARDNLVASAEVGKFKSKTTFVRVNEIGSKDFVEDLTQILCEDIDGIMPVKIKNAADIVFLDKLLSFLEIKGGFANGKHLLVPLIETADAVANVYEIAHASSRMVAMAFGGEDYLDSIKSIYTYQVSAFVYPRATLATAARSANLIPIDTPYLEISDVEGFFQSQKEAYKAGFGGCLVLNPKQIKAANDAFSPTDIEIENAKGVIDAVLRAEKESGSGVAMYNGGMVGPPMKKRAYQVMEQVRKIKALEEQR